MKYLRRVTGTGNEIGFSILQISYWCAYGAFSSFMVSCMQDRGMPVFQIGIMMAANTFSAFLGQFVSGILCDHFHTNRRVFLAAYFLLIPLECAAFFAKNSWMVIFLFGLIGFVQQPQNGNIDTWLLKSCENRLGRYGPIRASASAAYAVFMLSFGVLIGRHGYVMMLIFSCAFLISGIITAWTIPDIPHAEENQKIKAPEVWRNFLKNSGYFRMLIMLFGMGMASAPFVQFAAVVMKDVGGHVEYVGYANFISAVFQVPFMIFAGRKMKLEAEKRILAAACFYCVTLTGLYFSRSPQLVLLFYAVNGIGYGLLLPAMRERIAGMAPARISTTAQGVCDAMYYGLGSTAGGFLSGVFTENYGVKKMLLIFGVVQLLFIIVFMTGYGSRRKRNKENERSFLRGTGK